MLQIDYQMTKAMFDSYLKGKKNNVSNPYHVVIEALNKEYGLRGTVTRITIIDDKK